MTNTISTKYTFEGHGLDKIAKELDQAENKGKAVAAAIDRMTDEIEADMKRAESATSAFSSALGPEMVADLERSGSSVDEMIDKLRRLGLTYEDIEAEADELAASMKRASELDIGPKAASASGDVDKLSDSARGANSALANMVGNSAQDLGALAGVAGSAGVAIGQMSEYASDATLAGEGLGASLRSMAMVAGPIAALTIGMQLLGHFMNKSNEEQKAVTEGAKELTDALIAAKKAGDDVNETLDEIAAKKADEALGNLGDKTDKTIDALTTMGITYADVIQAFRDGTGPLAAAIAKYDEIDRFLLSNTTDALAHQKALEEQARKWGVSTDAAEDQINALRILDRSLGGQIDVQRRANIESQKAAQYMGIARSAADIYGEQLRGLAADHEHLADSTAYTSEQARIYGERLRGVTQAAADEANAEQAAADALDRKRQSIDAVAAAEDRRLQASLQALGGDIGKRAAVTSAVSAFNDPNMSFDQKLQAILGSALQSAGIRQTELESRGNLVDSRVQAQLVKEELAHFAKLFGQMFSGDSAMLELGDAIASALNGYIGQIGGGGGATTPFVGRFASGGVVPGPVGKPGVAIVHGGEEITPPGQRTPSIYVAPGAVQITTLDPANAGRYVNKVLTDLVRNGGRLTFTNSG